MNTVRAIASASALLALSLPLAAQAETSAQVNPSILSTNNQLTLFSQIQKVDYTENGGTYGSDPGTMDTENGSISGGGVSLSFMEDAFLGNDYLYLSYKQASGNIDYVGAYLGSGLPYGSLHSSSGASIKDFSIRYGKGFVTGANSLITPYLEFGHHRWDRTLTAFQEENYKHRYYGLGANYQYAATDKLILSANVMVGHTMSAEMDTNSAELQSTSLGNAAIVRAGLGVDYAVSKKLHLSATYNYETFKYGHSQLNGNGYYEPDSTTKYNQYTLGVGYAF